MLDSWKDGAPKRAVLDLVRRVTTPGPEFVEPAARIAVFDNDGTLWNEFPMLVQGLFLADRVKELAAKDPSMKERQPFQALLEKDVATLHSLGLKGIAELFFSTHAGMSDEELIGIARRWFDGAKHPKLGVSISNVTYVPQIELLAFLREHGFKTFIVTGGGIDFVRAISEEFYGIPRENVVGSSAKLKAQVTNGRVDVMKTAELGSFDDREEKVANIALHIGRRPILAFGNSDGDLAMLRYTMSGAGARLALLVHHDDAEREAAYDRDFKLSPLAEALDKAQEYGITLVSMKRDWNVVFR